MNSQHLQCPATSSLSDCVLLAHGEGGRLMRKLLGERIAPILGVNTLSDAAVCGPVDGSVVVTTDSFVVTPLFFPGGDIGSLAVFGTVNDLAVSGAQPRWLTLSLIVEEGLPLALLEQVVRSVAEAAGQCDVQVIAGDTKVVPRGAADQLFLNTTGIGVKRQSTELSCAALRPSDVLLVSGPIGQHGIAVLVAREQLGLTPMPVSDCAPLHVACAALQDAIGEDLRAMRDATRGGVSAVLHEWSEASGRTMKLNESQLPISSEVRGACELLGLDALYVANEGTFVAAVAPHAVDRAMAALHAVQVSSQARVIGEVIERGRSAVVIERLFGRLHPVDEPSGAPLPRIC